MAQALQDMPELALSTQECKRKFLQGYEYPDSLCFDEVLEHQVRLV